MLVVMDLLDIQILSRFKVHNVDVEIIFIGCWQQFPQYKNLRVYRQHRLVICSAILEGGLALQSIPIHELSWSQVTY